MKLITINTDKQIKIAQYTKVKGYPNRLYDLKLQLNLIYHYNNDLYDKLTIVKSTLSQHLKKIKHVGLIRREVEFQRIKYSINKKTKKKIQQHFKQFLKI